MKFFDAAFEKFGKKKPVSVMVRATLENTLSAEHLDGLFDQHAQEQYTGELLFSTVAGLMGEVVLRIRPSINFAWRERKDEIGVTVKSVYDKLSGIEPAVSRALVRETAERKAAIIRKLGCLPEPLVSGYRTKIIDGNHLRHTDSRIGALREVNVAPLPGKSLVILDPQLRLAIDVIPCLDGHAQERSLLGEALEIVEKNDLWIGDRNFCTVDYLFGIAERKARFVIRQHGNLPFELKGRRRLMGETETGKVYQQTMSVTDIEGRTRRFRRIEIRLNEPTRDGDAAVFLVTSLPGRISAATIADLYRQRWTIETAFQEMAENLEGEIETLGYPKAALFGFCMALVSYNLMSVVRAAVASQHGPEAAETFSTYYACHEVSQTAEGMSVVLPAENWRERYGRLTPTQMAAELNQLALKINLSKYRKNKWKKKVKPPDKPKKQRRHASTMKILAESRKLKVATKN